MMSTQLLKIEGRDVSEMCIVKQAGANVDAMINLHVIGATLV